MKQFVIGLVIGVSLLGSVWAADVAYNLRPLSEEKGPAACAADHGKAALVAEIDEDGYLTTEWEPFCLIPAK